MQQWRYDGYYAIDLSGVYYICSALEALFQHNVIQLKSNLSA